ncbi:MAG: sensor histidine kinase [Acidobacteriota bacterium]
MTSLARLLLIGVIAVLPAAAVLGYEIYRPEPALAAGLAALITAALTAAAHRLLHPPGPPAINAETAQRERELLQAKEAAESASRAKTNFLAIVSHEVRTPLNAVIGFSEMLRDGYAGTIENKQREYLEDILTSAHHLLQLMGDMLDMSTIEAGKIAVRPALVSVRDEIEASFELVRTRAAAAQLALAIDAAAELPPLWIDRIRFRQILLNLLSNAIKFTPPGGTVTVRAEDDAEGVAIAISDTGIGMCEHDIPRALEPFRQIDNVMQRQYEGVGLGLPLAKRLTELHGGQIDIASALGRGTTVTLHFPHAPPAGVPARERLRSYG